jgi:hypothetical protein
MNKHICSELIQKSFADLDPYELFNSFNPLNTWYTFDSTFFKQPAEQSSVRRTYWRGTAQRLLMDLVHEIEIGIEEA